MSDQPAFLYIEDHAASRKVLHMLLVDLLGYQDLTMLEDSTDIVQRMKDFERSFDIVFLDINVKPHDGYAVCEMLRADDQLKTSRILALTANVSNDALRRMQSLGFDGVLNKPLDIETFPILLERILAGEQLWEIE